MWFNPRVPLIATMPFLAGLAQAGIQGQVPPKDAVVVFAQLRPAAKAVDVLNPVTGALLHELSSIPVFMPKPPVGVNRWAASPAIMIRPAL